MMGFFFATEKEVDAVKSSVAESFDKVKQDANVLFQWVNYLYAQNQQLLEQGRVQRQLIEEQKLALNEIRVTMRHIPTTPEEIRKIVDMHFNFEPIIIRLKHIEARLEYIEIKKKHELSQETKENLTSIARTEPEKTSFTFLKKKLMRRLARSSKDYVKNMILGLVHKYGKLSALHLRDIVVEEQGLCSKSSFYRLLEEMEAENSLSSLSDKKNKVYVAHVVKQEL